ncbi:MAG TPA: hypothetical protein VFD54_03775 [Anaerolineales bacterium]|jgi:hypothetical protein|nr:hypothetical protein [Anaerolineales bacterium]
MQKENVKQTDIDEAGMADQSDQAESAHTGEEQMRNEQITEERNEQNKRMQDDEKFAPLFERDEAEQFRAQWLDIQSRFVDDPSISVKDADELVSSIIKNITRNFADKRMALETQWKSGDDVSTEDLRVTMKRYRSFFDRLLTLES